MPGEINHKESAEAFLIAKKFAKAKSLIRKPNNSLE
jgi:hypothetical protein